MGQQDILNFLKEHKGWHTTKEMAEELGLTCTSVNSALKKMRKFGEIKSKFMYKEGVGKNFHKLRV